MHFLVDEDLPRSTVAALRQAGYAADDVRDVGLRGRPDRDIYAYARSHGLVIVSADKDFSNGLHYPLGDHAGIVVLRIPDELPSRALNQEPLRALAVLHPEDFAGALVIVEPGRVRIRRASARA